MQTAGSVYVRNERKGINMQAAMWTLFGINLAYTFIFLASLFLYIISIPILFVLGAGIPVAFNFAVAAWWFSLRKSAGASSVMAGIAYVFMVLSIVLSLYCIVSFAAAAYTAYGFMTVAIVLLAFAVAEMVLIALLQRETVRKYRRGEMMPGKEAHRPMAVSGIWVALTVALVVFWSCAAYASVPGYRFYAWFYLPTILMAVMFIVAWWFSAYEKKEMNTFMSVLMCIVALVLGISGYTCWNLGFNFLTVGLAAVSAVWFVLTIILVVFQHIRRSKGKY